LCANLFVVALKSTSSTRYLPGPGLSLRIATALSIFPGGLATDILPPVNFNVLS
jgi:hypothetical protein